jgi:3-oxoacyl-[acyl-carrier protein] reductase
MSLDGKVVLVTGAGRGIGRAIALRLAADGAGVVAVARSGEELERLRGAIAAKGGKCWTIAADLRDPLEPERVVAAAVQSAGRLDVLVNNAGVAWCKGIADISHEQWRDMFALNMEAVFLLTKAVLPIFKAQKSGQIVNIGSDASIKGIGNMTCYCASKYALRGFTMALREELRKTGIRLNLIMPGPVNTTIIGKEDHPEFIQPADVADLVWQVVAMAPRTDVWEILLEPKG